MSDALNPVAGGEGEALVGSRWKRNSPGREVVEVRRVFDYSPFGDPAEPTVRAHPTRGGKPLVAPVSWFLAHYTRLTPPAEPGADS